MKNLNGSRRRQRAGCGAHSWNAYAAGAAFSGPGRSRVPSPQRRAIDLPRQQIDPSRRGRRQFVGLCIRFGSIDCACWLILAPARPYRSRTSSRTSGFPCSALLFFVPALLSCLFRALLWLCSAGRRTFLKPLEQRDYLPLHATRPTQKIKYPLLFPLLSRRNRENGPAQPAPCAWMRAISRLLTSQKVPNTQMPAASIAKMISEPFCMPPLYQIASSLSGTATISVPST
jgi:hypothetical protein